MQDQIQIHRKCSKMKSKRNTLLKMEQGKENKERPARQGETHE